MSGLTCLLWVTHEEHYKADQFSDKTMNTSYCRNPDLDSTGPWCAYGLGERDWETCNIPFCEPAIECRMNELGSNYTGRTWKSISGKECLNWQSATNFNASDFPDPTEYDAANYCRNPTRDVRGLYCLVDLNGSVVKEYCDISLCYGKNLEPVSSEMSN
ncbi:plasminogen-like [Tubulanus polymorphus]|uniref:plasminogen-like n=1 Tax=Tubulanus polymorphus TaxID=672921 RepID=UPI003DA2750E